MPTDEWDNVLAVNLSGVFYCCQSAARRMCDTGGGSITTIASVGGLIGLSHRPAHTAAKHGVRDLAADGIRVNAICPGLIRTPLTGSYFEDESFERGLATIVPQQRYGVAVDPAWGLERIIAHLAGFEPADVSPFANPPRRDLRHLMRDLLH